MKKSLLTLGLLGLASSVFAQANPAGPWVTVNTTNVQSNASFLFDQIQSLSSTSAWGLVSESVAGSEIHTYMRTNNAAGTEFDFGAIISTNASYQAANISAVTNDVAYVSQFGASGGGEILRTIDGGGNWRRQTTPTQFAAPAGFANWVHMFSATEGVALGDPNPLPATGPGDFEILRTTNGTTWSRIPAGTYPLPLDEEEYGLVRSYFALGNTIWAGTSHNLGGTIPAPVRVLKSVDKGVNWTVANTPLNGAVSRIAFKDQLNGIATTTSTASGIQVIRTTDGGTTWNLVTPTGPGKFYRYDIDAIPGQGFISVGASVVSTPTATDFGVSFSRDGLSWTDLENAGRSYTAVDFLNCTTAGGGAGYTGYLGGFTSATAMPPLIAGSGGVYQVPPATCAALVLGNRNAEVQKSLSVYPNPSTSGVFQVQLADGIKAGTQLTVVDVLGRQVYSRELSATAAGSKTTNIDLSKEKSGVYTLQVRTAKGLATQKLVIQ